MSRTVQLEIDAQVCISVCKETKTWIGYSWSPMTSLEPQTWALPRENHDNQATLVRGLEGGHLPKEWGGGQANRTVAGPWEVSQTGFSG